MLNLINYLVRVMHLRVFAKTLEKTLRSKLPANFCKLELRNSILTPEYFHFLYSDIDLAVVLKNCEFSELTKVRKILVKFKKFYPWMGEVEIYSEDEWHILNQLKKEIKDIYHPARSIRKYFWMGAPDDAYQGPKRLRALQVILKKLEISANAPFSTLVIEKLVNITRQHVKEETVTGENSFYHTYFTCPLLAPLDYTNAGHKLSAFDLVAVGSLFPTDDAGYFANKSCIDQLHENQPNVKAIWMKLKQVDQLELKGSQRGRI